MRNARSAVGADEFLNPRVVIAGEFSSGKTSLINLLLRQQVVPPSVGFSVHPSLLLRHGSPRVVNACHRDGIVRQSAGIEHAITDPDVTEVELYVPFERFPGVEFHELPAPIDGCFSEAQKLAASTADLFIWCTIGSQAWRLSEKDYVASLGRRSDQPSVLSVMRDDLIRSDSDRNKINVRLETEARQFFTDIAFVGASNKIVKESVSESAALRTGGVGLIERQIVRLPGADVAPRPKISVVPSLEKKEVVISEAQPSFVETHQSEKSGNQVVSVDEHTKSPVPGESVDTLLKEALDYVIDTIGKVPGFRYAAVVIDTENALSSSEPLDPAGQIAARALYFAYAGADDPANAVQEIVIRGNNELHLLFAIYDIAHVHIVTDPSPSALASVKATLRDNSAFGVGTFQNG